MDEIKMHNDALLLLEQYGQESRRLHESLKLAGYNGPAVVIEDDGFLPDDVMSAYGFFLGDFQAAMGEKAQPKYFNEITVPEYWEISGTNHNGKIQDLHKERGKIFYAEPKHKRLVRIVDWYDDRGVVRFSDHYNRCGAIYARTIFNAKGQRVNRSCFSVDGREIIVENFVTGDIILNEDGEVSIFHNRTDFVLHFFVRAGFRQSRIFFNSLSTPFFVSNRLKAKTKRDVLFWQEPTGEEIPGNMQMVFSGEASRTALVAVQRQSSYEKLIALGARPDMVKKLGYIYSFEKENTHRPEALICTNSDNLEHGEAMIKALPKMHFHIVSITEMSSKLTGLGAYANVSLYPGVKQMILDELFERCDYYLDVNHESEIVSAVQKAFLHNHLIFAFQETVHQEDYVAKEHIYPAEEANRLFAAIKEVMEDRGVMERYLLRQKKAAMAETAEEYQRLG